MKGICGTISAGMSLRCCLYPGWSSVRRAGSPWSQQTAARSGWRSLSIRRTVLAKPKMALVGSPLELVSPRMA